MTLESVDLLRASSLKLLKQPQRVALDGVSCQKPLGVEVCSNALLKRDWLPAGHMHLVKHGTLFRVIS